MLRLSASGYSLRNGPMKQIEREKKRERKRECVSSKQSLFDPSASPQMHPALCCDNLSNES